MTGRTIAHYQIVEKLGEGGKHSSGAWRTGGWALTPRMAPRSR